jgi:regulatory protein
VSEGSFRLDRIRSEPGEGDEPAVASLSGFGGQAGEGGATADLAEIGGAPEPLEEVADLRTAGEGGPAAITVSAAELAADHRASAGRGDRSATVADLARMIGGGAGVAGERRTRRRADRRQPADDRSRASPGPRRPRPASDSVGDGGVPRSTRRADAVPSPDPIVELDHEPESRTDRRRARAERAEEQAKAAIDADPVAVAREICLRLLTDRARTRQELAQALQRKGIPDEAADTVLSRFDEVGLIDDAAFAGQWVRSRHRSRGLSRRAIALELRRKGVDDEVAGEALAEVDPAAEEERAHELVVKKLRSMTIATPEEQQSAVRRLVGMLARKGYGAGVAYGVVRRALAERGTESDETDHLDE